MKYFRVEWTSETRHATFIEAEDRDKVKDVLMSEDVITISESQEYKGYNDIVEISKEEYDLIVNNDDVKPKSTIKQLIELTEEWKDSTTNSNLANQLDNLLQQMYEIDNEM